MSATADENKRRYVLRTEIQSKRGGTFKRPKAWERRNAMRRLSPAGVVLRRQP